MCQPDSATAFRPAVTVHDWKIIMAAIKAYSHNAEYRDLLSRLEHQAALSGLADRRPSARPPQPWA